MNTIYNTLPIINIYSNPFNDFKYKINKKLLNKHVCYRVYEKKSIIEFYGKVVTLNNKMIGIKFNDYFRKYKLKNIKEIELLNYSNKHFKKYVNNIVEIINNHDDKIIAYLNEVDNYYSVYDEITYTILTQDRELIVCNYPKCLIKKIKRINYE